MASGTKLLNDQSGLRRDIGETLREQPVRQAVNMPRIKVVNYTSAGGAHKKMGEVEYYTHDSMTPFSDRTQALVIMAGNH